MGDQQWIRKRSDMADIKVRNLGGRPSIHTPELAQEICDTIATSNKALQTLCQMHDHWPCYNAIYEWIQDNRCGFGESIRESKRKSG